MILSSVGEWGGGEFMIRWGPRDEEEEVVVVVVYDE